MPKPIKPEYQWWRSRIEGQIRHMVHEHPEYFTFKNEEAKKRMIRSMAKRVIGEIVAAIGCGDYPGNNATRGVTSRIKQWVQLSSAQLGKMGGKMTAHLFSFRNLWT